MDIAVVSRSRAGRCPASRTPLLPPVNAPLPTGLYNSRAAPSMGRYFVAHGPVSTLTLAATYKVSNLYQINTWITP